MDRFEGFEAVLFDLDGVLTSTAEQHFAAWKRMFDDFLQRYGDRTGTSLPAFERGDYNAHVDGIPRYDGVRNFLQSRGIELEEGSPQDPPDAETVCGLGNRKNDLVNDIIRAEGVEVYEGSVSLVRRLRERGTATAVVSSSRNCAMVLRVADIAELFDARVDGEVALELGLPGKPAPDTFLEAARRLQVAPAQAVVVEDALLGVEAGRRGEFGLVIGVDRVGQADAMRARGADVVVADLSELLG